MRWQQWPWAWWLLGCMLVVFMSTHNMGGWCLNVNEGYCNAECVCWACCICKCVHLCFKCLSMLALQLCMNVCLFWVCAGCRGRDMLGITQIHCDFGAFPSGWRPSWKWMAVLDTLCREETTTVEASLQMLVWRVDICDSSQHLKKRPFTYPCCWHDLGNAAGSGLFLKIVLCLTKSYGHGKTVVIVLIYFIISTLVLSSLPVCDSG